MKQLPLMKLFQHYRDMEFKMEFNHVSVLYEETIEGLKVNPEGIYLDGTLGGGGHSEAIVKQLTSGKLICNDLDMVAINASKERLADYSDKILYIHDDYKNILTHLDELGIEKLDGALLDLGISSPQIDNPERGFSYMKDAPLDMRMDRDSSFSALDVINGKYCSGLWCQCNDDKGVLQHSRTDSYRLYDTSIHTIKKKESNYYSSILLF